LLLSSRVAFHSINTFTAPQIIWGTLGGRASLKSFWHLKKAHQIWQVGSVRQNRFSKGMKNLARAEEYNIALTDKMGRPYTYRDVWELAIAGGGLRSQTAIIINAAQYQNILNDARFTEEYSSYTKDGLKKWLGEAAMKPRPQTAGVATGAMSMMKGGLPIGEALSGAHIGSIVGGVTADFLAKYVPSFRGKNTWGRFLTDMTEYEDQYFRLTQVIDGLIKGEDPFIALTRGKAALYDYGSLNPIEKWASSRLFMFYAFFKLNMANTMATLISNPKRFANIFRASQAPYTLFREEGEPSTAELNFYKHHFLMSRPILDYTEGVDKTNHFTVMPPIPLLDGMQTVAEILHAPNWQLRLQPLRDLINPELKMLLGQRSRIEWKKNYVDPVDIYLLDQSGLMEYFWDTYVGERPQARPAVAGDVHFQGNVYTLTEEGMKKYLYFKNVVAPFLTVPNVMGGDTIPLTHLVSDTGLFGKAFGERGEGSILGTTGIVRRVGTIPIQAQRINVIREIQKRLKGLEDQNRKQVVEDDPLDYIDPQYRDNIRKVREWQRQDEEEREAR